jgi:hypothetical protein
VPAASGDVVLTPELGTLRLMTEGGPHSNYHGATGITVIDGRLIFPRPPVAVVAPGSLSELARGHCRGGALRPRLAAALPGGAVRKE